MLGLTAKEHEFRIREERWSKITLLGSQKQPSECVNERKPGILPGDSL